MGWFYAGPQKCSTYTSALLFSGKSLFLWPFGLLTGPNHPLLAPAKHYGISMPSLQIPEEPKKSGEKWREVGESS